MLKLRRVLAATDLSDHADAAVREAVSLAQRADAQLTLLHVREEQPADEALEELRLRTAGAVPKVTTASVSGRPADAICEAADRLDVDLVVVGTHGRTGFRRILLGSVAERVVRHCPRAVLVSRPPETVNGYRCILAPTDFSPSARSAARLAAQLAAPDATLRLFHCYELPSMTAGPEVAEARQHVAATLDRLAEDHRRELAQGGIHVEAKLHRDSAVRGLLQAIDTGSVDLVALGQSREDRVRAHALGTVAEAVVRHAHCSALVVPDLGTDLRE